MVDIIRIITDKWGGIIETPSYKVNGFPSYLDKSAFNYLYKPIKMSLIDKQLKSKRIFLPRDIAEFYKNFNGVRLFLSALSIYGFVIKSEEFVPYDFFVENMRIHIEMFNNDCDIEKWFFFGSYAGAYVFAYDDTKEKKYICVERGKNVILKSFVSFEELMNFFITGIIPHYDDFCNKREQNSEYIDIPIVANSMLRLDEL